MLKRRIVQIVSLLILHSSWGPEAKWFCNPVLSCHSCPLSWFACPVGVFVHYSGYHIFPFIALGTVLLMGLFFGRLLCGWVCPFGLLQDMLYKIPVRKFALPKWTFKIKYFILLFMVVLFPFFLGEQTWFSFCRICPAASLQARIPNLIVGGFQFEGLSKIAPLIVLAGVIFFVIFTLRGFCKVLCPIGALLAPLNFLSFWTVKPPTSNCISCKKCDAACETSVVPSSLIERGEAPSRALDCIFCYECQPACPKNEKKKNREGQGEERARE